MSFKFKEPTQRSTFIIIIPIDAIMIDIQVFTETFSFKKRNPNSAVMNGLEARHNNVIAAEVIVMDHIKVIIAAPSPAPPIRPEIHILK